MPQQDTQVTASIDRQEPTGAKCSICGDRCCLERDPTFVNLLMSEGREMFLRFTPRRLRLGCIRATASGAEPDQPEGP